MFNRTWDVIVCHEQIRKTAIENKLFRRKSPGISTNVEKTASKSESPPFHRERVPVKDDLLPCKRERVPVKDDLLPCKRERVPAKDDVLPCKRERVVLTDDVLLFKDVCVPAGKAEFPQLKEKVAHR